MEQLWWKTGTDMVEQKNSDSGTVEQLWRNSGTTMAEQWNSHGKTQAAQT